MSSRRSGCLSNNPSRPRGRPRSAGARAAILAAARAILDEGGITAVTMEGIAARAGVGKPTIYRSWPNAHAVAMAALMDISPSPPPMTAASVTSPTGGPALEDLRAQLHEVVRVFSAPLGRSVTLMIAAAEKE